MNSKSGCSRRSFLAALGAVGSLFAPSELHAASIFGKRRQPSIPSVDGRSIVPITTGLGSTGGMSQCGCRLRFHLEAMQAVGIPRPEFGQHLDCYVTLQRCVAGAVYLSHAARAPSGATISNESSRVPAASDICGVDYTLSGNF